MKKSNETLVKNAVNNIQILIEDPPKDFLTAIEALFEINREDASTLIEESENDIYDEIVSSYDIGFNEGIEDVIDDFFNNENFKEVFQKLIYSPTDKYRLIQWLEDLGLKVQ